MNGAVQALKGSVPERCHVTSCNKGGCKVGLQGLPLNRIIVDMDCKALGIPDDQKRCDYLYVGEKHKTQVMAQVVPIELKSGKVPSASDAVEQLQKGADQAGVWLPSKTQFEFVPVLVHGGGTHREILKSLRSLNVQFRGKLTRVKLLKCDDQLTTALG